MIFTTREYHSRIKQTWV